MRIDQQVINLLKTYFVSKRGDSHLAGDLLPGGTDTYKLGTASNRWDTVYARQIVADSLTGGGTAANADTVDGIHASATSQANTLLALDSAQKYPNTAYPNAILRDGTRSLTGNLAVSGGVTIDGVDISDHASDGAIHHLSGMSADDHSIYVHVSSARTINARHTFNPASPNSPFILGANAQNQMVTDFYANRSLNLDRSVVAGTGLSGGGQLNADVILNAGAGDNINIDATTINLDTPGSLAHDTTNQVSTAHTHAVAASNNPGASASLLKSGADGDLYLAGDFGVDTDTLYVDVSEDGVYVNAGVFPGRRGALTVHPAVTTQRGLVLEQLSGQSANLFVIFDSTGNDLLLVSPQGDLESGNPGFVSGLTGWQIDHTGDAEFNNVWIRGGLHASVFVADEIHASGGTLAVLTASKLATTVASLPSPGFNVTLNIDASQETGYSLFAVDDILRIKSIASAGVGIDIYNLYFTVNSVGAKVGSDPGYYPTNVKMQFAFPTSTFTESLPAGTSVVKWGVIGGAAGEYTGGLILTSDLNKAPYMDVFTLPSDITSWASEPIPTPRVRVGNLEGVLSLQEQWGIAFGTDLSDTSKPYAVFSDLQLASHGIEQTWWDIDGNVRGAVDPSASGQDSLFWLGISGSDKKFEVTGDGLLRLSQAAIGPRGGAIFDGGVLWLPFDGNYYYGGLEVNSEYGMFSPDVQTGSIHAARGKYGSGFATGGTVTNSIANPNFSRSISTGWGYGGDGVFSASTLVSYVYTGSQSLLILAGTVDTYKYTSSTLSVPNGATVWVHCRAKVSSGAGASKARVRLWDTTNSTYRLLVNNTIDGDWELLIGSWTNNTGAAASIRVYLQNVANDSSTRVRFDAVMLHTSDYPKQYTDGDLPGCSWSGTPGNSTSDRTTPDLEYHITIPNTWTVSCWFRPLMTATETTYAARIWEWWGSADDRMILYQMSGIYRIMNEKSNVALTADTSGDLARDVDHHFVVTWDGTDVRWWVNNVEQTPLTPTESYGTSPLEFAVGTYYAGSSPSNGTVSDLFILNHAIDTDEVTALYNSTKPVVVIEEFSMRIYDSSGVTSITPSGFFIREGENVFGVNTKQPSAGVSGDTLTIGAIGTAPGDMVLGANVAGKSAIFWDRSAGRFSFHVDGSPDPFMRVDTEGMVLRRATGSGWTDPQSAIAWEDSSGNKVLSMGVIWDGSDDIFAWREGDYNDPVLMQLRGGTGGYLDLPSVGLNLGSSTGAAPGSIRGGGEALFNIISTGTNVGINNNSVVYESLYSDLLTNAQRVYAYYPLPSVVTVWSDVSSGSVGPPAVKIDLSSYGLPAGIKAVVVRVIADDVTGSLTDDLYFTVGPDGTEWDVTCRPKGSSIKSENTGICRCDGNGDIYYRVGASGSGNFHRWMWILGYFI